MFQQLHVADHRQTNQLIETRMTGQPGRLKAQLELFPAHL